MTRIRFCVMALLLLYTGVSDRGRVAGSFQVASAADPNEFLPRPDDCGTLDADRQRWWMPCAGRVRDPRIPFNRLPGYVLAGRTDVWAGAPDFYLSQENRYWGGGPYGHEGTPKLYTRSLVLTDKGDTPDLAIRRAGPDMSGPSGEPEAVPGGSGLGTIYWQAWGRNCYGGYGWYAGCGGFGRVAEIWASTVGEQTAASRAGALHFNTTPLESPGNSVRRFSMNEKGQFVAFSGGTPAEPVIQLNGTGTGVMLATDRASMIVSSRPVLSTQVPARNAQTSLTLVIRSADGNTVEQTVEVGDANSCGTGYRCLRVPN